MLQKFLELLLQKTCSPQELWQNMDPTTSRRRISHVPIRKFPQEKIYIFQTLNKCFKNRGNKQLNVPNIFGITDIEDVFPTRGVVKHGPRK